MYSLIPLVLTMLILIPLIGFAVGIIISHNKKEKEQLRELALINKALDYDNDYEEKKYKNIIDKFFDTYEELLKGAGVINPKMSKTDLKNRMLIIGIIIYVIAFLFSGFNVIIGLIPIVIVLAAFYVYCRVKINNIEHMMEEQIPSFLSTLKSNIQSNQTPERALMSAIDNTADPLYSELEIVKSLIETGTFETAMATLRLKTTNQTLKFLCSCIELSAEVGANLEEQIVVIEQMIESRKVLDRKMQSAVAENKPLMWVGMLSVPILFVYMYFMNSQTRDFWFKVPFSWLLLGFVILLLLFGLWAGNKVIDNIRKM